MLTTPDARGDFIACPVTSRAGWAHARQISQSELAEGTLPLQSWVRTDKVVTLHTDLIIRRFARAAAEFRTAIADDVCRFLHASHPA